MGRGGVDQADGRHPPRVRVRRLRGLRSAEARVRRRGARCGEIRPFAAAQVATVHAVVGGGLWYVRLITHTTLAIVFRFEPEEHELIQFDDLSRCDGPLQQRRRSFNNRRQGRDKRRALAGRGGRNGDWEGEERTQDAGYGQFVPHCVSDRDGLRPVVHASVNRGSSYSFTRQRLIRIVYFRLFISGSLMCMPCLAS